MKTILAYLYYFVIRFLLSLRYRVKVKGLKQIEKEKLPHQGGILFLANHPAEIDPCILLCVFWPKYRLRPVAIDYLFDIPIVRYLLEFIGALSVPNFDTSANSYKKRLIEKTYEKIFSILDGKGNLLIYPAGGLKSQAEEVIGGASGTQTILKERPETNIVLVRTTGLWGSSFSRALTGKTPDLKKTFKHGLKVLLKNGIFFTPRREVVIECSLAPPDFPRKEERREINRYLENWYNTPAPEPLKFVSFSFWQEEFPKPYIRPLEEEIDLSEIPEEIRKKIFDEVATLSKTPADQINPGDDLAADLGLDSLDTAQILVLIKEEYGISGVQASDLTTVGSVMAYAARLKKGKEEEEEKEEKPSNKGKWTTQKGRPPPLYPEGETIPEVFFKTCDRMGSYLACVDQLSGELSYNRLKIGVILLAQAIKELPGERIGIMLPATVAVNVVVLATMLAGKVPVMINWTLGERNLRSVVEQSGIKRTLSSWAFIDRLNNINFDGLDDQILLLEEIRRNLTLTQKLKAFLQARKKSEDLLKIFNSHRVKKEDPAVILFTSGTESAPKGVPLSHKNIMENQKGAYEYVNVGSEDILVGALPSFHSFGFSVTGLFPLLAGLRVAYTPNPTDGRRVALAIQRWSGTLFCMAPTFLKNLLRVASEEHLRSLTLVVTGAEKTPKKMFEEIKSLNPNTKVIEGYGITECGPILTLNPPDKPLHGVGIPLPGVELLLVNPETLAPLNVDEEGVILARGPNVFEGYLDPDLPSPFVEVEEKMWYKTGDLGSLNSEGYLTLSGRLKRFVKIGGEMVSLGAIEEVLTEAASDKGWELDPENPSLAVCALEEEGKKSEIHLFTIFGTSSEEVNKILRQSGMSNLIKIRSVTKISSIPQLGTGKIDYKKLTEKLKDKE
ncbi:MAG: AMP-binding protein [Chlamydiales bacterium]|nr:AMP-binding protein [Chlamydiales bacterium]